MKTRKKPSHRRFQLKILYGDAYYIDRVARLKAKLAKKPRSLQIDMVGAGDIPADTALQIRSALTRRWAQTRIITHAHSSLQGGSVLVWLLGDKRVIRDDAKLFFRRTTLPEDAEAKPDETWKESELKCRDSYSEIDPDEGDYARVLQLIDEYLPVKELAGRLIGLPVLRQFGLVENEKVDHFLTIAFSKSDAALVAR